MEQGMDPEVKRFFKRILFTISFGLSWLIAMVTAGFYFELAWQGNKALWSVILFYAVALLSFLGLLLYFYRLWKK